MQRSDVYSKTKTNKLTANNENSNVAKGINSNVKIK